MSKLLGAADVADVLGVSVRLLRQLLAEGKGPPAVRVSPRRRGWRPETVERWLADREQASRDAPAGVSEA